MVAAYLGLAPVYWLPFVDPVFVRAGKGILLVLALIVWFMGRPASGLVLPRGLLGPAGFVGLAVLAVPGMYQAWELSLAVEFLVDVALSALFVWLLFSMQMKGHDTFRVFVAGMAILSVFAVFPVASALFGVPMFQSPFDQAPFRSTGFGAGRTGWANALSLYVPIALASVLIDKRRARKALTSLVAIVMAQVVSGGRAGLLLSLFSIALFVALCGSRRMRAVVVTLVVIATLTILLSGALRGIAVLAAADQLRLGDARGRVTFQLLDALTSYRLRGYVAAVELIAERPLAGYGFDSVRIRVPTLDHDVEIHNVWLKFAVYCGVLFPLYLLFMVLAVMRPAIRTARESEDSKRRTVVTAYSLVLLSGVGITLVEPAALVGSFQNSALWWGVAGSVLAVASGMSLSQRRVRQRPASPREAAT